MASFIYRAADARGRKSSGEISATDRAEAVSLLRERSLFPLHVAQAGEKSIPARAKGRLDRGGVLSFTQELATLLEAGLPLDRALGMVADLTSGESSGGIAASILRDVRGGAAFSAALERQVKSFGEVYVHMVRAGEAGGVLPLVLRRLSGALEEERELRAYILGAVLYPAVVAAVSLGAVAFLLLFVVPSFSGIFSQLDQELPLITVIALALSGGLRHYGLWALAALAVIAYLLRSLYLTPGGRERADGWRLGLPYLGDLHKKLNTARIARTLSMLAGAGVPVLKSLAVTGETVKNTIVRSALSRAAREIKEGGGIARRLEAQNALPALAVQMIAVGEETGRLPEMLDHVAARYEAEVRHTVRSLLSLLEPALVLCLTAVVLFIALSILIPIVRMSTGL